MSAIGDLSGVPTEFLTALSTLRQAQCRSELRLAELAAPSRLAPFAVALGAEVIAPNGQRGHGPIQPIHGPASAATADTAAEELATGRFILLYDLDGSALWEGNFRIVTYIRAELEADIGNDAMLGSVAWTWLVDALASHQAPYRAAGGTATRILSESYGTLADRGDSIDIELRASWTPTDANMQTHLQAWSDMGVYFRRSAAAARRSGRLGKPAPSLRKGTRPRRTIERSIARLAKLDGL